MLLIGLYCFFLFFLDLQYEPGLWVHIVGL